MGEDLYKFEKILVINIILAMHF